MYKNLSFVFVLLIILFSFTSFSHAEPDSVIATIPVGTSPTALVYNSANNKIYCANYDSITVTNEEGVILSIDSSDWCGGQYQVGDTIPVLAECHGFPVAYRVFPPYPNPSTDSTKIYYSLPTQSHVSFVLYDQDGDSTVMFSEDKETGCHSTVVDLSGLGLGLYHGRFKADGYECYGDIWVGILTDVPETSVDQIPSDFHLFQNYPNPFNPVTRILFTVGSRQRKAADGGQSTADGSLPRTTLKIYNILGQKVKTLVDEPKRAGGREVIWDGKDDQGKELASGIYFYRLKAGYYTETKKMLLLR